MGTGLVRIYTQTIEHPNFSEWAIDVKSIFYERKKLQQTRGELH